MAQRLNCDRHQHALETLCMARQNSADTLVAPSSKGSPIHLGLRLLVCRMLWQGVCPSGSLQQELQQAMKVRGHKEIEARRDFGPIRSQRKARHQPEEDLHHGCQCLCLCLLAVRAARRANALMHEDAAVPTASIKHIRKAVLDLGLDLTPIADSWLTRPSSKGMNSQDRI